MVACRKDRFYLLLLLNCRGIGRCVTWHVYVYHRVTGNSIYNLKRKQTERWVKRELKIKQQITVHRCNRGGEEEREGRRNEVGRVGGRRKRQGMGGTQSREKNLNDGGRWCTSIYCTHCMTNLHAIVVNSLVFQITPPSH